MLASSQSNVSLKSYNTFGMDVLATRLFHINSFKGLKIALKTYPNSIILGGGSNILFTKPVDNTVLYIDTKGKRVIKDAEAYVEVKVQAGESWHDFVTWAVLNNYGGIENLALIPGKVGAAPIQNIGAYGKEIKDVLVSCEVYDKKSESVVLFSNKDCGFVYRGSIFKRKYHNQLVVKSITVRLTKDTYHNIDFSYKELKEKLGKNYELPFTIKTIYEVVIALRKEKLPDYTILGNCGSFFKNSIVDTAKFEKLVEKFPNIPYYKAGNRYVKIPSAWLIDQAGFKGKRINNVGVYEKQALVLVNYGGAVNTDVLELINQITTVVFNKFQIMLTPEVNIM